jgi:hypothetical protein
VDSHFGRGRTINGPGKGLEQGRNKSGPNQLSRQIQPLFTATYCI